MTNRIANECKKICRHGATERLSHWLIALSTFILIFTGFGQMPLYKRYFVDQLPGLAWSSDYSATVLLHYTAAAVLAFTILYHLVYHGLRKEFGLLPQRGDVRESYLIIKSMFGRCKAPECDKYLAEQRLAYAYIGFNFLIILISGIFKVLKNVPGYHFSPALIKAMAMLHNAGTILLILGILFHLAAFLLRENRPLVPSIFTGKVDLAYVEHRHQLWHQRLTDKGTEIFPPETATKNKPVSS